MSVRCGVGDKSPRPQPPHSQPEGSRPWPHAPKDGRSGVGERPTPDAPHRGNRRPPHRAPSCRPHSAPSQLTRVRAVGLVTGPHARTPHTNSQWVVGPGRTTRRTGGWGWESARPRTPHTEAADAPPPGTLLPPPKRAKPARMSARCGVDDGSPHPHPPHPQPAGSGPRPHAPKDGRFGAGRAPNPGRFTPRQEATSRAPSCRPHSATPAAKSARCGVDDWSPRPQPLHPRRVGSGPRPHAPKDGRSGVGGRPTPDAPHPGERRLPRAPSCCPRSAQSQHTTGGLPAGSCATPSKARGPRDRATPPRAK